MHPAPSVILFSTLSGLGFGMLAWLGIGSPVVTGSTAFWAYVLAYGLAVSGLVSSTFHLGNPQRAIKAFTQWKTSWLSREAWMSVSALVVMALYAAGEVFFSAHVAVLGWLGAILSLITVFTTSMIYAQLKTVPRWNNPITNVLFLLYAITGGALLTGHGLLSAILLVFTGVVQLLGWTYWDTLFAKAGSTLESATGLGFMGKVRQVEPPHTGTNYLLDEMIYVVGRKHAKTLRMIAILLAAIAPAILVSLAPGSFTMIALAALLHFAGIYTQRWLFFAEAEHVVGLYYDKR